MDTWYVPFLSSLVSGLIGAGVVYLFGVRQDARRQRNAFREKQLSEFYAPLAGMRRQVRAKSELRLKISGAANAAWRELVESYEGRLMTDGDERYVPFGKIIEYENAQLTGELIPRYREMLALFTERYHLADADTRAFYPTFLEFVEIWNRSLANALPGAVLEKLDHDEENLKPFYEHLEARVSAIQQELLG